ncbi:type IV pilin protein [Nitrincola lacisaponensis]|uniref:type IV pilin protein n=1 Tax=Nitrincola lacisaponensis TaxID=267850 RepID=UPI0009FF2040|nr:type IV pilin protein [Nitrincola lacisaponensis]
MAATAISLNTLKIKYFHFRKREGFSLIELMIVVAIVAILASIAYPSYQDSITKSRRAEAQANLLELAQFMERYYTANNRYNNAATTPPSAPVLPFDESPKDGANKYYDLSLTVITANTYTLTATPKGAMAGDGCGNLTLNHAGVKGRSGALALDQCWRN